MSPPSEHDNDGAGDGALGLEETELRLGLPGSESPGRDVDKVGVTLELLPPKSFGSRANRGFPVAIDGGTGKWAFAAGGGGSEKEMAKGGVLCSPKEETTAGGKPPGLGDAGKDAAVKAVGRKTKASGQGENSDRSNREVAPAAKALVVGWPPIRSYRKNTLATNPPRNKEEVDGKLGCLYVKVSMDGAPYLRKVDLRIYGDYKELSSALDKMFSGLINGQSGSRGIPSRDVVSESWLMDLLNGSEYVLTYEDKDGDWTLVGDVPWEMFTDSCRRLRIMKGSDAIGLAPRAMEKCKNKN